MSITSTITSHACTPSIATGWPAVPGEAFGHRAANLLRAVGGHERDHAAAAAFLTDTPVLSRVLVCVRQAVYGWFGTSGRADPASAEGESGNASGGAPAAGRGGVGSRRPGAIRVLPAGLVWRASGF